jgi:hypothetical protein
VLIKKFQIFRHTVKFFLREITAFIAGNFIVLTVNSHRKSIKSHTKPIKMQIFLVLFVVLLIFFVNSLLKQQNTQLPAMKAVSHENF